MTEFRKPNAERRQELSVENKFREFFILQTYTFILTRLYSIYIYIYMNGMALLEFHLKFFSIAFLLSNS